MTLVFWFKMFDVDVFRFWVGFVIWLSLLGGLRFGLLGWLRFDCLLLETASFDILGF